MSFSSSMWLVWVWARASPHTSKLNCGFLSHVSFQLSLKHFWTQVLDACATYWQKVRFHSVPHAASCSQHQYWVVAWFPALRGGEKECLVSTVYAWTLIAKILGKLYHYWHLCYINFCESADSSPVEDCIPQTTFWRMTRERWKHSAFFFARIIHVFLHSS